MLWKSYTVAEEPRPGAMSSAGVQLMGPSGAAVWSSPTFDAAKDMLYVTTGDNYSDPPTGMSDAIPGVRRRIREAGVVAADHVRRRLQRGVSGDGPANCPAARGPDFDFGSSAILVSLANGKRALIAGQKSGVVTAVDPDRGGAILWQTRVGHGGALGGVQWGSAADATNIYVAVSDTSLRVVAVRHRGAQTIPSNPNMAWLLDGSRGGGSARAQARDRRGSLAHAAPGLRRNSGLRPRAIGRCHGNPGRRVLGRPRRSLARLFRR